MSKRMRWTRSTPSSAFDTGTRRSPRSPSNCKSWRCTFESGSTTRTLRCRVLPRSAAPAAYLITSAFEKFHPVEARLADRAQSHVETHALDQIDTLLGVRYWHHTIAAIVWCQY